MKAEQSAQKLMQQADILATYSALPEQLLRAYLTPEHKQAHQQIATWMTEAGLQVWQDSVGNQWGRKVANDPSLPTLIIGSHSDTVVNAGKYDGNLGVLLGIEALSLLKDVELPFNVDVVAFADEEGTRFNTTLIGSSAVAGCFQSDWLKIQDANGISMQQAMIDFGLQPELVGSDKRKAEDVLAYLEVHIEQGPVLESKNLAVGVVTAIAGAKRYQLKVKGMAGHAGTVPIELRQDALCGVAEMISSIEAFARQHDIVATVGKCTVPSGAVNVIPGEVNFTLDIRSQDQSSLDNCCEQLFKSLQGIAQSRCLQLRHEKIYQANAVPCSERLQQKWGDVVKQQTQQTPCFLHSGAGHDALAMYQLTEVGMLFVRCEKGISHHPREQVETADVQVALNCLVEMIKSMEQTK